MIRTLLVTVGLLAVAGAIALHAEAVRQAGRYELVHLVGDLALRIDRLTGEVCEHRTAEGSRRARLTNCVGERSPGAADGLRALERAAEKAEKAEKEKAAPSE